MTRNWLFPDMPMARLAFLRRLLAGFVVFDMTVITPDVMAHADGDASLYQPLLLRRVLELPYPSPDYVRALAVVLVVSAVVVIAGRLPRLAGWVLALGFLDWVALAFSYGKVDHDHFALVAALFLLPTVEPAARDSRSEAAGFAIRGMQVACVCTYFLSAWAKIRFGGWNWPTGATFAWAMQRRGTGVGRWLAEHPNLLVLGQFGVIIMEALTPAMLFVRARLAALAALALIGFHLATWALTHILFLPTIVCLLAFFPLEELRWPAWVRRSRPRRAGSASAPAAPAAPASAPRQA